MTQSKEATVARKMLVEYADAIARLYTQHDEAVESDSDFAYENASYITSQVREIEIRQETLLTLLDRVEAEDETD